MVAKAHGELIAEGVKPTADAIAEKTGLSDKTVKNHRASLSEILEPFQKETAAIYKKLAVKLKQDPKAPELKLWNQTVHGWSEKMIFAEEPDDPTSDVEFE